MNKKLKVTLIRSLIGRPKKQRMTIFGLGLKKLNKTVLLDDRPEIRGMVKKVSHLVKVEWV